VQPRFALAAENDRLASDLAQLDAASLDLAVQRRSPTLAHLQNSATVIAPPLVATGGSIGLLLDRLRCMHRSPLLAPVRLIAYETCEQEPLSDLELRGVILSFRDSARTIA
jgi:hypothetical protein